MKAIGIFGVKYRIKIVDLSGSEHDAIIDHTSKIVLMDKKLKGEKFCETLVHELGHAMFETTGLNQTSISADLQEVIVENFSKFMIQNFDIKLKK